MHTSIGPKLIHFEVDYKIKRDYPSAELHKFLCYGDFWTQLIYARANTSRRIEEVNCEDCKKIHKVMTDYNLTPQQIWAVMQNMKHGT